MRGTHLLLTLWLAISWAPAQALAEPDEAGEDPAARADHLSPLGNRTRAWLERQRSGEDASPDDHGLTPPAERRVRQRYLHSFEHPIPNQFEPQKSSRGGK